MGTWSTGVFGNDTAADVRSTFRELLEDGRTGEEATSEILAKFRESLSDRDDAPFFWTGLAAAQHRLGRLQSSVRDKAVEVIDAGADLHLWEDAKMRRKRQAVLIKLRSDLLGSARPPVHVRRPHRKPSPVAKGDVFELRLENARSARFRVIAVDETRYGDWPIVEMVDEHGRAYEHWDQQFEKWRLVQFEVTSPRKKDRPTLDDVLVVGTDTAKRQVETSRGYLNWPTLRVFTGALFDDSNRLRLSR